MVLNRFHSTLLRPEVRPSPGVTLADEALDVEAGEELHQAQQLSEAVCEQADGGGRVLGGAENAVGMRRKTKLIPI